MTSMPSGQRAQLPVERRDRFTRQGLPDAEFGPLELVQVERVDWVTQFHEHVVGDVDDIVDGSDAGRMQPCGQPRRRGADTDVGQRKPCSAGRAPEPRSSPGNEMGFGDGVSRRRARGSKGCLNASATSRAMPRILRQSGRFAVISKSSTVSPGPSPWSGTVSIEASSNPHRVRAFQSRRAWLRPR